MRARIAAIALCVTLSGAALAGNPPPDVRVPPGTRADAAGILVSGSGLRETSDFFARDLEARGVIAKQIGPYRVRGVELTRFVSQTPATSWLAIHVLRRDGKTLIFFVPRPKA
ncbi:MAG: hypothetical protein KF773_26835 [Deltaproteobacteria bacterium]|nr:hypothetical protein [Deltaproteobacteria bacterium]MCW5803487.1 hypothetical protein [Deltaproteobacteria bacterium]